MEKKIDGTTIILEAEILEKKSKLRNLFEKEYRSYLYSILSRIHYQTLNSIALKDFREKKISVSNETINLIIERTQWTKTIS